MIAQLFFFQNLQKFRQTKSVINNHFSVDDGFPEVIFNFENSLSLHVYPHDYLFQNEVIQISAV